MRLGHQNPKTLAILHDLHILKERRQAQKRKKRDERSYLKAYSIKKV